MKVNKNDEHSRPLQNPGDNVGQGVPKSVQRDKNANVQKNSESIAGERAIGSPRQTDEQKIEPVILALQKLSIKERKAINNAKNRSSKTSN